MAVLYATREDLEFALSKATVVALYTDDGRNAVNEAALAGNANRASRKVDSFLARVYVGPFPVTQTPVPEAIKEAALEFFVAFSFERHPEYVHTFGQSYRAQPRFERADAIMQNICEAKQEIPDWVLQPKPRNVGGIIRSGGPRTIIDTYEGEDRGGDF